MVILHLVNMENKVWLSAHRRFWETEFSSQAEVPGIESITQEPLNKFMTSD